MRKIFLDCGSHKGESVGYWRSFQTDGNDYEFYCFECDLDNVRYLKNVEDVTIIRKAVWTKEGKVRFYQNIDRTHTDGGSLLKDKTTGNLDKINPVIVESLDIAQWIQQHFTKDDHIVMKLNIEGAEYHVIQHM